MGAEQQLAIRCTERPKQALAIRCVERPSTRRCAYCHDALTEEPVTCKGCQTLLHAGCVDPWGRCPTLGCAVRGRRRVDRTAGLCFAARAPSSPGRGLNRALAGVILPVLALAASESGLVQGILPSLGFYSVLDAWWALCLAPAVHRPFYPLLLWAVAAFAAAESGRRGRWIETGLLGGCALSFMFCVLLLPFSHLSMAATLLLIGFLGLSPYFAFASYLRSYREQRRARLDREATAEGEEQGAAWLSRVAWVGSWLVAVAWAGAALVHLHRNLLASIDW